MREGDFDEIFSRQTFLERKKVNFFPRDDARK